MKKLLIIFGVLIFFISSVVVIHAQQICYDGVVPAGALPGQPSPRFCYINDLDPTTPDYPVNTEVSGTNDWHDNFNHGLFNTSFTDTNYNIYHEVDGYPFGVDQQAIHWRHANHWMVDQTGHPERDAWAILRPNRSFTVKDYNGTPNDITDDMIIIEADAAAGHDDYDAEGATWQEIDISTAPAPIVNLPGGGYAYDVFPGHFTFGCRLQASRVPVCALKDNGGPAQNQQSRLWEMSFFQYVGTERGGGEPSGPNTAPPFDNLQYYWRRCNTENDPDSLCRDRFRIEITRDSMSLYVNGRLYFIQSGDLYLGAGSYVEDPLDKLAWGANGSDKHIFPKDFWYKNGDPAQGKADLYVYYSDVEARNPSQVIRYHWDNLTVNTDRPNTTCAETFVHPDGVACQDTPPGPADPTPTPTATPGVAGDINGDGLVNIQDFILLSNAFGTADPEADLNSDGIVNIQDYVIFSGAFGS